MLRKLQHGVVLIIVLWFMAIVTVLVAALASEIRLSTRVVWHNKHHLQLWADTLSTMRRAEMELLISRMPDPAGQEQETTVDEEPKSKAYRFNGQIVHLVYPAAQTTQVRIYDHAGKISLRFLSNRQRLQELLEKRIGSDPEQFQALYDAYLDWIDRDDLKHAQGAEKEDYEEMSLPYEPRNARLETVEELLLIKGFDEVFKDVNIQAAFTAYSNRHGVDPNLATQEALMLLPGLNQSIVNQILLRRRETEFKSYGDFQEFIEPEQWAKVKNWFTFSSRRGSSRIADFSQSSNIYTIAVQAKPAAAESSPPSTDSSAEAETQQPLNIKSQQQAYMVTVQYRGFNRPPKTLMVNPYGILPDTQHEQLSLDEEDGSDNTFKTL